MNLQKSYLLPSTFYLILVFSFSRSGVSSVDPEQSSAIFGVVERKSIIPNYFSMMTQCFEGFGLRNCIDRNTTQKGRTSESGIGEVDANYCLECCSKIRTSIVTTETWNLACSLENVINTKLQDPEIEFRFPRRLTLDDTVITNCSLKRSPGLLLHGYNLTLLIREISTNFGISFWRSVLDCKVIAIEESNIPLYFYENIQITTSPGEANVSYMWIAIGCIMCLIVVVYSIPVYNGCVRGQKCVNCSSWMVLINGLCIMCVILGCRIHPPRPKIFIAKEESDSQESESDLDSDDDMHKEENK